MMDFALNGIIWGTLVAAIVTGVYMISLRRESKATK